MHAAIELSLNAVRSGSGGPFGAVVVSNEKIVGRGQNRVLANNDPTAHAEIEAIRDACRNLQRFDLSHCELYTSCEPCPMCLGACYWARFRAIYFAATRDDAARIGFDDAVFYEEITKPVAQRRLHTGQVERERALLAFEQWRHSEHRRLS